MQGSDNHFPKVILEERLADGSDTATPDADHRAVFMGEDGVLYEKDAADVVNPIVGSGYAPGGTDVAVADGGTGASSASAARTNLGLVIGTDVAAQSHASQHEAGGSDEIDATGLVGAGGGGGGAPLGLIAADVIPASPGSFDEEWEGTADTLPANWSWIGSAPATVKINSRYESLLVLERPASNGSTYELRRASFAPGAIDFGLWWKWSMGIGQYNNNGNWMSLDILNSGETEAQCFRMNSNGTHDFRQIIASSESSTGNSIPMVESAQAWVYAGLTRTAAGSWRCWISMNGLGWTAIGGAASHAVTADRFRFRFNSGNNAGLERNIVDWVRYRTDLEFPRP